VNSTAQDEIGDYVEAVRAALVGLPGSTRDELLEDLPEHLAEVLAEGHGTLTERLGSPVAYAAELRASAGFVGGFPDPPPSRWTPFAETRDNVVQVLRQADVKVGPVIGYPKASDFLVLLRPAWWVLRGYLAAMAIAYLFDYTGDEPGLLPRLGGSDLFALVLLAGCVIGSILVGKRTAPLTGGLQYAMRAGTVFLGIFALVLFSSVDSSSSGEPGYNGVSSYDSNPYSNVQDVFVYDGQGRLVPGARLFDQDGSPIQLGNPYCTDPETGETGHTRNLGYPYCPDSAPFGPAGRGSAGLGDPAEPTATPTGSPAPGASGSPPPPVSGSPSPIRSSR
jgi:hypothetical protein